jgi:hypothetical protein
MSTLANIRLDNEKAEFRASLTCSLGIHELKRHVLEREIKLSRNPTKPHALYERLLRESAVLDSFIRNFDEYYDRMRRQLLE